MSVSYPAGTSRSPELPTWSEPGSTATWYGDLDDDGAAVVVHATARTLATPGPGELPITVSLGTGMSVVTR